MYCVHSAAFIGVVPARWNVELWFIWLADIDGLHKRRNCYFFVFIDFGACLCLVRNFFFFFLRRNRRCELWCE